MADENNKIGFVLDLDNSPFLGEVKEAFEHVSQLAEGLGSLTIVAGVIGAAFLAVKESLDLTLEAEQIKKVNAQFEALTANAGIASDALIKGLKETSNGLITEHDLLVSANKAIVEMGSTAANLPAIMEMARKATSVFGGELSENFERLNNAIATGSVRQLRHLGIIIDHTKAIRDFATAHGIAENALSEHAKQQAVFEAIQAKVGQQFKGQTQDIMATTTAWKQFKVALAEIGEMCVVVYDKLFGSAVKSLMTSAADTMRDYLGILKQVLGSEKERDEAKVETYKKSLAGLQRQLVELQKAHDNPASSRFLVPQATIDAQKNKIEALKKTIEDLEKTDKKSGEKKGDEPAKKAGGKGVDDSLVDKKVALENEVKFQKDLNTIRQAFLNQETTLYKSAASEKATLEQREILLEQEKHQKIGEIERNHDLTRRQKDQLELEVKKEFALKEFGLRKASLDKEIASARSVEQVEKLQAQRKILLAQHTEQRIAQIKRQFHGHEDQILKHTQQLKRAQAEEEIIMARQVKDEKVAANQRWMESSQGAADGVARGFAGAAQKQTLELATFEKAGERTFASFSQHSTQALEEWGAGHKTASQAAKGFLFGFLGDRAIAEGAIMMLSGIWPPNPVALAGGAALIALGGALKAASGGGGGGGGAPSMSMGGGGGYQAPQAAPPSQAAMDMRQNAQQNTGNSTTIIVQGHIFDGQETRNRMADLVRQASDGNDFRVQNA